MPRVAVQRSVKAPPPLEAILKRVDEAKRGKVKGRTHKELLAGWAKSRKKAVARLQVPKRSNQ